jgi:hypothetical protein
MMTEAVGGRRGWLSPTGGVRLRGDWMAAVRGMHYAASWWGWVGGEQNEAAGPPHPTPSEQGTLAGGPRFGEG